MNSECALGHHRWLRRSGTHLMFAKACLELCENCDAVKLEVEWRGQDKPVGLDSVLDAIFALDRREP